MNAFQICKNTSDVVPLYLSQQIYLKPITRITMSVHLPRKKIVGKSISNWEIMEKLRGLIKPDEFSELKVVATTLDFIRFEAEIEEKSKLNRLISKIDNKMIQLKDISQMLPVRAAEWKQKFPNRHTWDCYFREARNMDETKPGERPDTIHISYLPIKWFVPCYLANEKNIKPSEKIFYRVFEKFGNLRHVDIPICDPYRNKMKSYISGLQTFSSDEQEFFEGYIQFKDYIGFTKAMNALRGMKLLRKDEMENYCVNIKVDFDRTKHLSDASIRRREIVRDRLITNEKNEEEKALEEKIRKEESERQKEINLKKEKETRRRMREEKRKTKILSKIKVNARDKIDEKIAREEKKLLKVQRKLEAIRLLEALFKRINEKKEIVNADIQNAHSTSQLAKLKFSSEAEVSIQKEKLHKTVAGRAKIETLLAESKCIPSDSNSSDDSLKVNKQTKINLDDNIMSKRHNFTPWKTNDHYSNFLYPILQNDSLNFHHLGIIPRNNMENTAGVSRGFPKFGRRSGFRRRFRNINNLYYPPDVAGEYHKYFYKFLREDRKCLSQNVHSRSKFTSRHQKPSSPSRSRSTYNSKRQSKSRSSRSSSSSRCKSKSTSSRSRSKSLSRSRYRSRSRSRSRYRLRSRSRSVSKFKSRSISKFTSKLRTRSRSHS